MRFEISDGFLIIHHASGSFSKVLLTRIKTSRVIKRLSPRHLRQLTDFLRRSVNISLETE